MNDEKFYTVKITETINIPMRHGGDDPFRVMASFAEDRLHDQPGIVTIESDDYKMVITRKK